MSKGYIAVYSRAKSWSKARLNKFLREHIENSTQVEVSVATPFSSGYMNLKEFFDQFGTSGVITNTNNLRTKGTQWYGNLKKLKSGKFKDFIVLT